MLAWCVWLHPGIKAWLDQSVMLESAREGGRLLDLGCGDGGFLSFMSELGWSICGVDPDPVAVKNAVRRGLDARIGLWEADTFESDSFDAIIGLRLEIGPRRFAGKFSKALGCTDDAEPSQLARTIEPSACTPTSPLKRIQDTSGNGDSLNWLRMIARYLPEHATSVHPSTMTYPPGLTL